jgi:hypothetical protein
MALPRAAPAVGIPVASLCGTFPRLFAYLPNKTGPRRGVLEQNLKSGPYPRHVIFKWSKDFPLAPGVTKAP